MLLNIFCIAAAIGGIVTCVVHALRRERGLSAKGWERACLGIWIASIAVVIWLQPQGAPRWICLGFTTLGAWWTAILALAYDNGGPKPPHHQLWE